MKQYTWLRTAVELSFTFWVRNDFGCQQLCKCFWRKSRNFLGVIRGVQTNNHFFFHSSSGRPICARSENCQYRIRNTTTYSRAVRRSPGHLKILRKNHNRTTIDDGTRSEQEAITVLYYNTFDGELNANISLRQKSFYLLSKAACLHFKLIWARKYVFFPPRQNSP